MRKEFNPLLVEKAKQAKSVAELTTLAKENGWELTTEEAAQYFARLHPQSDDISDEELENVAGGGCSSSNTEGETCGYWVCMFCGQSWETHIDENVEIPGSVAGSCVTARTSIQKACVTCQHRRYEGGTVVCNHPR